MTLLDWSTSMIGYPAHSRSGVPVIGVSHCPVHDALRFAEAMGLFTGWVAADAAAAHLIGLPAGRPCWAVLAECFVENRIVRTEGPVGGSLLFAAAVPADGEVPADRGLIDWAEGHGRPWLEVRDNEMAYWGGLAAADQAALLCWFCEQRPLRHDSAHGLEAATAEQLLGACYAHGLSRNGALVEEGRRRQQIWAGIHAHCMLDHDDRPTPSQVDRGFLLQCDDGIWSHRPIARPCPLDDQRGRAAARGERA